MGEIEPLTTPSLVGDLPGTVQRLCDRGLIQPSQGVEPGGEPYEFLHQLVRDAAYETLPKANRADLHERFAGWIEESLGPRVAEYQEIVGYHLSQAHTYLRELSARDPRLPALGERASERLGAAGTRAVARGDAPAAERLLDRAAELSPDAATRARCRLQMLDSLVDAGGTGRAQAVLRAARDDVTEAADPVLTARLHLAQANHRFLTDPDSISLEELRTTSVDAGRTLAELGDGWSLAGAISGEALVGWLEGDAAAMLDASERGLDVAIRSGNRREATVLAGYLFLALERGETPYPVALERIRELEGSLSSDRVTASARLMVEADFLGTVGEFEEAQRKSSSAIGTFSELGQERWVAAGTEIRGHIAELQGHLEEAERLMMEAYGFFDREGDVANASVLACGVARVLNRMGRHEEAEAMARKAQDAAADYDLEAQVAWRIQAAEALAARGDLVEAESLATEAAKRAESTDFVGLHADSLAGLADVHAASGRRDLAVELWTRVHDLRSQKGNVVGVTLADEALAALSYS